MYCVYVYIVYITYKIICIYVQIANNVQIAHVCKHVYIVRLQTFIFVLLINTYRQYVYSVCKLHILNKYAIAF